jgi:hydrogenase-4 component E
MISCLNALLVIVVLLNLLLLGTSRIRALIQAAAFQGVALGILPILIHPRITWLSVAVAAAAMFVKGAVIPKILLKALRDANIKREVEPIVGFIPSMLLGAAGTAAAMALAAKLPTAPQHLQTLIIPASLSTLFTGFLLLTTRAKAITQAIGYLLLDNGIFIFGLLLLDAVPFLVEVGVLLDLFVAIFVISIIIHHINREFDSLDTRHLSALKE